MKVIQVSKFDPLEGDEAQDTVIEITKPLPEFDDLDHAGRFYQGQAVQIADALTSTLPQATLHRLFVVLLERYPTYYRGRAGS